MNTSSFLLDLAIPTFNEKKLIERTLYHLTQQELYKKGKVHIIIADFKNELNIDDIYMEDLCKKIEHITYIPVFRKGIAFARNTAFKEGAKTDIFMNFDADGCFNRTDAIDMMISPILDKTAVMTNCETILFDFDKNEPISNVKNAYVVLSTIGNILERSILSRGPGITCSREAFEEIGGFRDVMLSEDYFFALDIIREYGMLQKKFIDGVKILTSARRAIAFDEHGTNILDYNHNSYR